MTPDLHETRMPGVGVKYTFTTVGGSRVTVVQHNDGDRELYVHARARDDEPAAVLELTDAEARRLGAVLGGVVERPRIVEELELALGQLKIEWIPVPEHSWVIGRTIGDCGFRKQTGISVIAILRDPEPIAGAQAEDVIDRGDILVVVGKEGQYPAFRKMLVEQPAPAV